MNPFEYLNNMLYGQTGITSNPSFSGNPEPFTIGGFFSGILEKIKMPNVNVNVNQANLGGVKIPMDIKKYTPYIILAILGLVVFFIVRK